MLLNTATTSDRFYWTLFFRSGASVKPPENNWPATDNATGVLLFAQLFRDVIDPETFESFRSYTLDTPARLKELLFLATEIQKGNINKLTADPAFYEVLWSIRKDIVLTDDISGLVSVLEAAHKSNSAPELIHAINFVLRSVNDGYKERIEEIILKCFDNKNARIRLRQSVSLYCSHLINLGYSRKYLKKIVDETFFQNNVLRTGRQTLSAFFRNFGADKRKYRVFTHVNATFGRHLKQLGYKSESRLDKTDQIYQDYIANNAINVNNRHLLIIQTTAIDENNAVHNAHRLLSTIKAIAYVVRPDFECDWDDNMFVHTNRSMRGSTISEAEVSIQRYVPAISSSRTVKAARSYTRKILTRFDRHSMERLASSINTAALAHSSSNAENQIISLWSSIEVLISSPLHGETRITYYIKNLKPLICLRHPRRKVVYVYDQLGEHYGRSFHKIVNEDNILEDADQHTKFAGILFLAANEVLRRKLLSLCAQNPLAMHRLFMLHRDYSSTKKLYSLSVDHAQRIEWQIHRIYRARNQLVHNGKMPRYVESLIINMDEYFRYAIGTIINKSDKIGGRNNIDQMVFEISADYNNKMKSLEKIVNTQDKTKSGDVDKYSFDSKSLRLFMA